MSYFVISATGELYTWGWGKFEFEFNQQGTLEHKLMKKIIFRSEAFLVFLFQETMASLDIRL